MYMSLFWEKRIICEVSVHVEKNLYQRPDEDKWHIEISSYFDVKTLLDLYENDFIGASYFREDMGSIQKYRLNYNEGCDIDFPKPQSYSIGDQDLNKDKNKIIDVIRRRLQSLSKMYNLTYKED